MKFHTPSSFRSLSMTGALVILAVMPAHAAVTLTFDTAAETFIWSGSATSDMIAIAEDDSISIRLGLGNFVGGTLVDNGASSGSLITSLSPAPPFNVIVSYREEGRFVISPNSNSFYTDLVEIFRFSGGGGGGGDVNTSVSITGDNQAYSFGLLTADRKAFLASLDGRQLFFQNNQGGGGINNIGAAAANIVVVPEPSCALLLVVVGFFCTCRRCRATVSQGLSEI